jgi:purine-binding chemotaxis protein CheW
MPEQHAQMATFFVDGLFCGIDVLQVQEVLREQEMTPVPLAPPVVEGLINLRGQIVTALDVRRRLGLPRRDADCTPMSVVVRAGDSPVSLLVDDIGEVVSVDASDFEAVPPHIDAELRKFSEGVYKLDGRLLLVLSTERVANL